MARALHRLLRVLAVSLVALCLCSSGNNVMAAAEGKQMVGVYELRKGDFSVKVTNWGATLMSVILPDSKGTFLIPPHAMFNRVEKEILGFWLQGTWPTSSLATTPSLNMW